MWGFFVGGGGLKRMCSHVSNITRDYLRVKSSFGVVCTVHYISLTYSDTTRRIQRMLLKHKKAFHDAKTISSKFKLLGGWHERSRHETTAKCKVPAASEDNLGNYIAKRLYRVSLQSNSFSCYLNIFIIKKLYIWFYIAFNYLNYLTERVTY